MSVFMGEVVKVGVFENKDPKEFKGKLQTHRYAVQVKNDSKGGVPDNTWISMGNGDKADFVFKDTDDGDKWKILGPGSKVKITYEKNGDYYNSGKSKVTIIEFVEGERYGGKKDESSKGGSDSKSGYKKSGDNVGMQTGHNLNTALNFLLATNQEFNKKELFELAKKAHVVTESLKAGHRVAHPEMSDYDVGASVGHAVKGAAFVVEDFDQLKERAKEILEVSFQVEEFIKSGGKTSETKEEKKSTPKKTTPPPVMNDMDDQDIPFAPIGKQYRAELYL